MFFIILDNSNVMPDFLFLIIHYAKMATSFYNEFLGDNANKST
jgi:hypothetical protein